MLKYLAGRFIGAIKKFLTKFFCLLIRAYQICISPLHGPTCRFTPTCSAYALEALLKRNVFVAIGLIIYRLLRCNPLAKGGYDPVPDSRRKLKWVL